MLLFTATLAIGPEARATSAAERETSSGRLSSLEAEGALDSAVDELDALRSPIERPPPGRPARGAAGVSFTAGAAGASSAYLRPGEQEPELIGILIARPFIGWHGRRIGARLGYSPAHQRYLVSGLTGFRHDVDARLRWRPRDWWSVHAIGFGGLAAYRRSALLSGDAGADEATVESRTLGAGAGLVVAPPGAWAGRVAAYSYLRSSAASNGDDQPTTITTEMVTEASGQLAWRAGPSVEISAGPVFELVTSSSERLSFRGAGLRVSSFVRPWRRGEIELSIRCQNNSFRASDGRGDLYMRGGLAARQAIGEGVELSLHYSHTANSSLSAAYDADRHLVMFLMDVRSPTWLF